LSAKAADLAKLRASCAGLQKKVTSLQVGRPAVILGCLWRLLEWDLPEAQLCYCLPRDLLSMQEFSQSAHVCTCSATAGAVALWQPAQFMQFSMKAFQLHVSNPALHQHPAINPFAENENQSVCFQSVMCLHSNDTNWFPPVLAALAELICS
jgi:hypothetical protein